MILNLKIDKYNKTTLKIILDNGILICIFYICYYNFYFNQRNMKIMFFEN